MRTLLCLLFAGACAVTVWAQDNSTGTGNRPRVFITDSKSWEMSGGGGGTSDGFGGASRGGARPQTAEIIKTFGERCPDVIVNNKQEKADYVVLLDHEGGKGVIFRDNKVAVFNADGDSIVSRSTRSLGNAVKDACDAISKDWPPRQARKANERAGLTGGNSAPAVVTVSADPKSAELEIESNPAGAEIEIDGNFVGSTPSSVSADPGQHQILVKKAGYQPWQRNVKISGGHVRLDAELEVGK